MARRTTSVRYAHGVVLSVRGDGRIRVRYYTDPGDPTTRTERTFPLTARTDAEEFAERVAADLGRGSRGDGRGAERPTRWGQLADRWLEVKAVDWQEDIALQHRQLLDKWARPFLDGLPIDEVRKEDYQRVFAAMVAQGRSASRGRVRALLAQLEKWAADNEYRSLRTFPIRSTAFRKEAAPKLTRTVGTDSQFVPSDLRPDTPRVRRLGLALPGVDRGGSWWRQLQCDVAANSGLRLGETFAIRSCHVDLAGRTLSVLHQYVTRPGRPPVLKLPKGEKVRTAVLFPSMCEPFARRLDEIVGDGPVCVDCASPKCGLLFPGKTGGPDNRSDFGKLARAAYELTQTDPDPQLRWPRRPDGKWLWTWHMLRHHAAVQYIDSLKLPISDVALLLGHSEDVLMKRYYGAVDGMLERVAAALDNQRVSATSVVLPDEGLGRGPLGESRGEDDCTDDARSDRVD